VPLSEDEESFLRFLFKEAGLDLYKYRLKTLKRRIAACLRTLHAGLLELLLDDELLDRTGGALSGGEQQLLAIARCLCGNPKLVLLDEPTEGIQPSIIDEIIETLQWLRAESGLTMILVEQNLDFIAALSQRILIIQKGAITREVAPDDLGDASLIGEFVGIAT